MNILIINYIEHIITDLIHQMTTSGRFCLSLINISNWNNFETSNNGLLILRKNKNNLVFSEIKYNQARSRYRLSIILYILAEVHQHLLQSSTSMFRELFYKNPVFTRNQTNIYRAVHDVCGILQTSPWNLGIFSSGKGLIAGAISICLHNGDVIDCRRQMNATLLPQDIRMIHHFQTNAALVLIIEKDTVFEYLLSRNILSLLGVDIILITGRGYPDMCTRYFVNQLNTIYQLPVYILVDADPYGIEIMLVYRHGSRTLANGGIHLACPNLLWVGIHPSEINVMPVSQSALSMRDRKKINDLLKRNYLSEGVRHELQILHQINSKAEIEGFASNAMDFLINDYIPNKIIRNLLI
ncbi:meiotic recombination protein W68 [Teleopsis dalmanni]|uniref:meiotic recombination protein W68 n=1 Tax=Teleopsis dalmanni TaxID=139649 RepID=UPI0018CEA1DC|nr:meiotic recombination protein W68 [Teleopsis dalmanni]